MSLLARLDKLFKNCIENATIYNRITFQIILLQIQLVRGPELSLALLFETTTGSRVSLFLKSPINVAPHFY